jgi:hypothetical protein
MTQMSEVEGYFASLQSRLHQAEHMTRRKVGFEGWTPEPAKCHENVDFWVSHNPSLKPVRGWILSQGVVAGRCLYEAHSVIEEEGVLYDITLREDVACERVPFLRHVGTEEEFSKMRDGRAQILFPPITVDEWLEAQSPPIEEGGEEW